MTKFKSTTNSNSAIFFNHKTLKPKLFDVIASSYHNNKAENKLRSLGFRQDTALSDSDSKVWVRTNNNKTEAIHVIAGTHNLKDIKTDLNLFLNPKKTIKKDDRFQNAKLKQIEMIEKYQPETTTVVGHSLGGLIASELSPFADKVISFNKAALPTYKSNKPNEVSIRTKFDPVSFLNRKEPNTFTFYPSKIDTHSSENLKDINISLD